MQAATLETLEQASIPPQQVRALARAFEIEMTVDRAELATKADLALGLEKLGSELRAEIQAVRTELRSEIQELRTELRAEIQELRAELRTEVHALRTEMQTLRTEMQSIKSELVRWVFTLMLAQTAVLFAGVYVMVKLMLAAHFKT